MVLASVLAAAVGGLMLVLRRRFVVVGVEGRSMAPALLPGDRVLVRRVGVARVAPGQIVVVAMTADRAPDDPPWLIKRVVAVPGDPVPVDRVPRLAPGRVPDHRLVLLSDNPDAAYDSRRVGYFDAEDLLGVMVRRVGR
jgi:signal peptidase I